MAVATRFLFGYALDAGILRRSLAGERPARPSYRQRVVQKARRYEVALLTRLLTMAERAGVRGKADCVACGWSGAGFRPLAQGGWLQRNAVCPSCGSVQRQRLVALVIEKFERPGAPVVWVAPEGFLENVIGRSLGS